MCLLLAERPALGPLPCFVAASTRSCNISPFFTTVHTAGKMVKAGRCYGDSRDMPTCGEQLPLLLPVIVCQRPLQSGSSGVNEVEKKFPEPLLSETVTYGCTHNTHSLQSLGSASSSHFSSVSSPLRGSAPHSGVAQATSLPAAAAQSQRRAGSPAEPPGPHSEPLTRLQIDSKGEEL